MKLNEIKELLNVIDKTNLEFVKIESGELKLEVSKNSNKALKYTNNNTTSKLDYEEIVSDIYEEVIEEPIAKENINMHIISAPLMGTYYSSPGTNEGNFVNIGDKVKKGDPLCILEAMKLMNEINSDIDGEIIEILVKNEELVEYGQPIFKIKPL